MPHPLLAELPAQLTVIRYPDEVTERHGYGPESAYPEEVWLSLAGPSCLLMWRRLARIAIHAQDSPATLDTCELLQVLGLGTGLARNSVGARTVGRMVTFDMARQAGHHGQLLAVRTALPRVPEHRAARLPAIARKYHLDAGRDTARPGTRGLFRLGKLHATPGAIAAMANTNNDPDTLLARHHRGDWGDIDINEALANNEAITNPALIHSIYQLDAERTVWIITEADRTATTITTPEGLSTSPGVCVV